MATTRELVGFYDYCRNNGIVLLDIEKKYLRKWAQQFPFKDMRKVLFEYVRVRRKAIDDEPIIHKKDNAGRVAANVWIREYLGE